MFLPSLMAPLLPPRAALFAASSFFRASFLAAISALLASFDAALAAKILFHIIGFTTNACERKYLQASAILPIRHHPSHRRRQRSQSASRRCLQSHSILHPTSLALVQMLRRRCIQRKITNLPASIDSSEPTSHRVDSRDLLPLEHSYYSTMKPFCCTGFALIPSFRAPPLAAPGFGLDAGTAAFGAGFGFSSCTSTEK